MIDSLCSFCVPRLYLKGGLSRVHVLLSKLCPILTLEVDAHQLKEERNTTKQKEIRISSVFKDFDQFRIKTNNQDAVCVDFQSLCDSWVSPSTSKK